MATGRIGNLGLNAAILLLGSVMLILGWSLVGGSLGGGERGEGGRGIVQLDVRNGCGTSGVAARMAAWLREQGIDVVETGDWTRFDVERTVVIDRIGDRGPSERVVRLLELDPDRVQEGITTDYYLDATLVVGCDYGTLPPFRE